MGDVIPKEESADSVIATWQEPERERIVLDARTRLLVIVAAAVVTVALIGIGIWQKSSSYYLGALVAIVASVSVLMQKQGLEQSRKITLTRTWLVLDEKRYALADLAGFWLERDGDYLVINVESKKSTLVPISFFYSTLNTTEARRTLTQALPEIEPRHDQASSINRYFRF